MKKRCMERTYTKISPSIKEKANTGFIKKRKRRKKQKQIFSHNCRDRVAVGCFPNRAAGRALKAHAFGQFHPLCAGRPRRRPGRAWTEHHAYKAKGDTPHNQSDKASLSAILTTRMQTPSEATKRSSS